eukprot:358949-Chlamydomonas_euryale.AAC.6
MCDGVDLMCGGVFGRIMHNPTTLHQIGRAQQQRAALASPAAAVATKQASTIPHLQPVQTSSLQPPLPLPFNPPARRPPCPTTRPGAANKAVRAPRAAPPQARARAPPPGSATQHLPTETEGQWHAPVGHPTRAAARPQRASGRRPATRGTCEMWRSGSGRCEGRPSNVCSSAPATWKVWKCGGGKGGGV